MDEKFLSMLGLCMKAGKLCIGHDASKQAIKDKKTRLCLISCDASQRLIEEMRGLSEDVFVVPTEYSMEDIKNAVGKRAGVLTVNDEGFTSRLMELINKEGLAYGC